MADFDFSVVNGRRSTFQLPQKNLRYGNFEGVKALPHVGSAAVTSEQLAKTGSHFNNKRIFQKVCQWFETWMPWQKRILLCGITDRCSSSQLEYLATALEPVFHRDFSASLNKEKFSGTPPKKRQEEDPQMALLKALQMATKGTKYEGDYLLVRSGRQSRGYSDLEGFAQEYVKQVIEGALEMMYGRFSKTKPPSDHQGQFQMQQPLQPHERGESTVPPHLTLDVPKFRKLSEEECLTSESTGQLIPTITTDSDHQVQRTKRATRTLTAPPSHSYGSQSRSPARSVQDLQPPPEHCKHGRHWTFPGCQNLHTPLFSDNLTGRVATDSGTNFTPGYGTGSYAPLQANKVSTLTWCMKHQRRDRTPTSPASPGASRPASHHHNSHVSSGSVSTRDFFEHKQQSQKLGTMFRALRTGQIRKPDKLTDVSIPLQKTFKHAKWWGKEPTGTRQLVPAHHKDLKEHFKNQIAQVWVWMQDWEELEKGDLLVELIKMCDQDLLKFLADCLQQRLRDRNDINCLPDKLLLHIFSFLPAHDIFMAERVCRRWRYIGAQDALWRIKCQGMGAKEGLLDLPGLIEEFNQGYSVDWRSAYTELCEVAQHAKKPAIPTAQVGETGTKKWLSIRFTEFMKKWTQTPESVKLTPIESESLSSEESSTEDFDRKHSTVVDVPIQFMKVAVEAEESEEDVIEELTMSEFAIQGLAQDFNLFPELTTTAELPAAIPFVKPTELGQPLPGRKAKDGSVDETRDEEAEGAPGVAADKTARKKKKKKKKKAARSRDDDVALDIRPELVQAKDILSELQGDVGPPMKSLKHPGWVKPIKRVRRLQGHTDAVFCLMFDKCRILTGSMDRTIRVWDIRSGRSIRKIYGHKGGIRCLQFDDTRIVSGSWDMTVMVWDIVKFDNLATLTGHVDVVSCLQFNKAHLVTGSHDSTIRVWSMDDYRCLQVLRHHRDSVTCLVFDGRFVTSGSADRREP